MTCIIVHWRGSFFIDSGKGSPHYIAGCATNRKCKQRGQRGVYVVNSLTSCKAELELAVWGAGAVFSSSMPLPKVLPQVQNAQGVPVGAAAAAPRVPSGAANHGKVVANRYSLERKLGSGAFGTAYLVTDRRANSDK